MFVRTLVTLLCLALVLIPLRTAADVASSADGPPITPVVEGQAGPPAGAFEQAFGAAFRELEAQFKEFLIVVLFELPTAVLHRRYSQPLDGVSPPVPIDSNTTVPHNAVSPAWPGIGSGGDPQYQASYGYVGDGTTPGTLKVELEARNPDGTLRFSTTLADDVPTINDPLFNRVSVAVDSHGYTSFAYNKVPIGQPPQVTLGTVDRDGNLIRDYSALSPIVGGEPVMDVGPPLTPGDDERLFVTYFDFLSGGIGGGIVTPSSSPFTGTGALGGSLQTFAVSTTGGVNNRNPAIAVDPDTGAFFVAWENVTNALGDVSNVRGRRFDADGNPVGDDFVINTTLPGAQGRADVAIGPNGEIAVVWQGDAATPADAQDVFLQVYDAAGDPIGGEIRVNTFTTAVQDRPDVEFISPASTLGSSPVQLVVLWRDVGAADGSSPRGSGASYRVFEISGTGGPGIFADGFESGDTNAWSSAIE